MNRLRFCLFASAAALTVWTGRAYAELITFDLSSGTEDVIESLGTKLVLACLILGVSAIICVALLRKR